VAYRVKFGVSVVECDTASEAALLVLSIDQVEDTIPDDAPPRYLRASKPKAAPKAKKPAKKPTLLEKARKIVAAPKKSGREATCHLCDKTFTAKPVGKIPRYCKPCNDELHETTKPEKTA
jgi:hypothetical protein